MNYYVNLSNHVASNAFSASIYTKLHHFIIFCTSGPGCSSSETSEDSKDVDSETGELRDAGHVTPGHVTPGHVTPGHVTSPDHVTTVAKEETNGDTGPSPKAVIQAPIPNGGLETQRTKPSPPVRTDSNKCAIADLQSGAQRDSQNSNSVTPSVKQGSKSVQRVVGPPPPLPVNGPNVNRIVPKRPAPPIPKTGPRISNPMPNSEQKPTPQGVNKVTKGVTKSSPLIPTDPKLTPQPIELTKCDLNKRNSGKDYATPINKPVIEVKLVHRTSIIGGESPVTSHRRSFREFFRRDTHSQSPSSSPSVIKRSPQSMHNGDDKWISRSMDDLDLDTSFDNSETYSCTLFIRDPTVKLRHSFIHKASYSDKDRHSFNSDSTDRHSFTDKDRDTMSVNSSGGVSSNIGDVQTVLRNSLVDEEEKIYSLPQPACYGDNTLKAVKKITEKYDSLQRRKMRALSFREGAKYSGPGVSFSQPSSPISPEEGPGGPGTAPDLPSNPPPPLSTEALPPPPLSAGALDITGSSTGTSVFDMPDTGYTLQETGSSFYDMGSSFRDTGNVSLQEEIIRKSPPPPPPPRMSSPPPPMTSQQGESPVPSVTSIGNQGESPNENQGESPITSEGKSLQNILRNSLKISTAESPPGEEVVSMNSGLTPRDIARIDLFYHGRDTEIIVAGCLADLTFGSAVSSGSEEVENWTPIVNTGVPLFILNTGKGTRRRELLITLADRETGFPLWSDKINYLSNFRESEPLKYVMQLHNNLRKVAGLKFYSEDHAKEFVKRFKEITANPNDELWKVSSGKMGKQKKRSKSFNLKRSKPKKSSKTQISVPCNFSHITNVDPQDVASIQVPQEVTSSSSLPSSPTGSRPVSVANSNC